MREARCGSKLTFFVCVTFGIGIVLFGAVKLDLDAKLQHVFHRHSVEEISEDTEASGQKSVAESAEENQEKAVGDIEDPPTGKQKTGGYQEQKPGADSSISIPESTGSETSENMSAENGGIPNSYTSTTHWFWKFDNLMNAEGFKKSLDGSGVKLKIEKMGDQYAVGFDYSNLSEKVSKIEKIEEAGNIKIPNEE